MTFLAVVAILFGGPGKHHHRHGVCRTKACEKRVQARWDRRHPMRTALASWYEDGGATASSRHYQYGFAALIFGSEWGKRIRFCSSRCVTGTLDDHGPYVGGRTFDFNGPLKRALGCSDLCTIRWRAAN